MSFTVIDSKGVTNFFDETRIADLAKSMVDALGPLYPKAKPDALEEMTTTVMTAILSAYVPNSDKGGQTAQQRLDLCEQVTAEFNPLYTSRARKRVRKDGKPSKAKASEQTSQVFLQYVSLLAFVLLGDVIRHVEAPAFKLIEATSFGGLHD